MIRDPSDKAVKYIIAKKKNHETTTTATIKENRKKGMKWGKSVILARKIINANVAIVRLAERKLSILSI